MTEDINTPNNPETRAIVAEAALQKLLEAIDAWAFSKSPKDDGVVHALSLARQEAIYVLKTHEEARRASQAKLRAELAKRD